MSLVQNHTSVALIRHPEGKERKWLVKWVSASGWWTFVTAERIGNESWRECLDRELAWVFPLRRGKDYLISSMARLHLEEIVCDSQTGEDLHVAFEFFVVDPYGRDARKTFDTLEGTRWVTTAELLGGNASDGTAIDPQLTELLLKADILPKG